MIVLYSNGIFNRVDKTGLESGRVKNSVIVAKNEGWLPFMGTPEDMAMDALAKIGKWIPEANGLFPVIYQSSGGVNKSGQYSTEVIFQAVTV